MLSTEWLRRYAISLSFMVTMLFVVVAAILATIVVSGARLVR